ncbi:MAG: ABC-type transport system involved in multi-copper enzyme maturation permease subunit [Myxococcota bacterium]
MNATHAIALLAAESTKLLSRPAARLGLVLAVVFGIAGPTLLWLADGSEMQVNGTRFAEWMGLRVYGSTGQLWALEVRNAIVMPVFVMWLAAASLAGEYQARTLREDFLRPVPRSAVLLAKWGSAVVWIGITLALTWVFSAVMGLLFFGLEGSWGQVALGFSANLLSDATLAALALLVAVAVRNVPATLVGLFLLWALSVAFGWFLGIATTFLSTELATTSMGLPAWYGDALQQVGPWLPSEAMGVWEGGTYRVDWVWQHFASLALTTATSLGLSALILERSDVP